MTSSTKVFLLISAVAIVQSVGVILNKKLLGHFPCPASLTWIHLTANSVLSLPWLVRRLKRRKAPSYGMIRTPRSEETELTSPESDGFGGHDDPEYINGLEHPPLTRLVFFYALYIIANVSSTVALTGLNAAVVTALFATAPAFVCVLSMCWLGRAKYAVELLAAGGAITGMVLSTHPWAPASSGDGTDADGSVALAIGCGLAAPAAAAVYKVAFSKYFSGATESQVGLLIAKLSGLNLILGLPLLIIAIVTKFEENPLPILFERSSDPDDPGLGWIWGILIATCATGMAFNFSVNYAVTVTYPLLVSVATIVSAVLTACYAAIEADQLPTWLEGVGFALIVVSFGSLFAHEKLLQKRAKNETQSVADGGDVLDDTPYNTC